MQPDGIAKVYFALRGGKRRIGMFDTTEKAVHAQHVANETLKRKADPDMNERKSDRDVKADVESAKKAAHEQHKRTR